MPERFLISRLSALGDTVCTLPVAVALKKAYPESHIVWAVDPRFAGVVECCDAVDEVCKLKPKLGSLPMWEGEFDVAFDMQGLLKSASCIAGAKAKRKLGYHWQREGSSLFSQAVLPDPSSFHVVDQYVDVVRAIGVEVDRAEFGLTPKEEDILSVRAKLKAKNLAGRFVVLNAGAGWATKRWAAESFAAVADELAAAGIGSVLVGGKADADQAAAQEVLSAAKSSPVSLLGETSVRELIALIRLASAHVGGDTGSTHIAAALNTPAVGLYSITRPQRSCPYGQIDHCHYDPNRLNNIQPSGVLSTLRAILEL